MATSQTEVEAHIIELSTKAFETFCEDITGMFGANMECSRQQVTTETVKDLEKHFKNLAAVNSIKAEGSLDGTFQIIFDRVGLFTLAGLIAMPEQMTSLLEKCVVPAKIQKNIKEGSLKEAQEFSDTIAEAGNLLVGSWNRVFREEFEGHRHFSQTNTFIGNPWDKPDEKIGLTADEELLFVSYKMTIGPYPPFVCSVTFPKKIFATAEEIAEAQAQARAQAEAEAKAKAEVEEKARAETEEKAKAEAIEKAKAEAEEKAKAEVEAKFEAEAEAKANAQVEAEDKAEAEEKAKAQAEEKAKAEAEEKTEAQAEEKTEAVAEEKTETETEEKAEAAAEEKPVTIAESKDRTVSETIQKMAQSSANLPGEQSLPDLKICAKDIMQKEVVWGSPDDSIQQTLAKMQQYDAGYMMIGADGALEGIASKSDITGAISPYLRPVFAKWRRPLDDATLQIRVKWIMSRPVHTIKPETPLTAIMESMRQFGGRCLPVVDQDGKVQGFVTVFDIFKALLETLPSGANVSTVGETPQAPALA